VMQLAAMVNQEAGHARELVRLLRHNANCKVLIREIRSGKLEGFGEFGLINVDGTRRLLGSTCLEFLKAVLGKFLVGLAWCVVIGGHRSPPASGCGQIAPHAPGGCPPGCPIWQDRVVAVYALGDREPRIAPDAFISPEAVIIGDVVIGSESSVWPGAVLRGDHGRIVVGEQTSIQDGAVLHCSDSADTVVGDRCTIGHSAHLEGCAVLDDSLIGSGAVVLAHAQVGPHALVGAAALVPEGLIVPEGARALGVPARVTSDVVGRDDFQHNVEAYVRNVHWYRANLKRLD